MVSVGREGEREEGKEGGEEGGRKGRREGGEEGGVGRDRGLRYVLVIIITEVHMVSEGWGVEGRREGGGRGRGGRVVLYERGGRREKIKTVVRMKI